MTKVAVVKVSNSERPMRVQIRANSTHRSIRGIIGRRMVRGLRAI